MEFQTWLSKEAQKMTEDELAILSELKGKHFRSVKEILNTEFPESQFLVGKLIPYQSISVISGYPGVGKTWFLLFLAKAVAEGSDFINEEFKTVKANVGIIEEENGERELKRRFQKIGINENVPIFVISQRGLKIDREEDRQFIIWECKQNNIGLIIFDPFVAIHSKTENSAEEMQKVMEALQEIQNAGITVVFTHHHKKQLGWTKVPLSQNLRGSSVIFGRVDSHIALEVKKDEASGLYLIVRHEKLRNGKKIEPFEIRLFENEDGLMRLEYIGQIEEEKMKVEEAKEIILNVLGQENQKSRQELIEILKNEGISQRTGETALKLLKDEHLIQSKRMGRRNIYFLTEQENNQLFI